MKCPWSGPFHGLAFDGLAQALCPDRVAEREVLRRRVMSLQLAEHKQVVSPHQSGQAVRTLEVEPLEGRFVMSGVDGGLTLHEVRDRTADSGRTSSVGRSTSGDSYAVVRAYNTRAHEGHVSQTAFYPHDSGLFVSSGTDGYVRVWDTHAFTAVSAAKLPPSEGYSRSDNRVTFHGEHGHDAPARASHAYAVAFSTLPDHDSLVAVGSNDGLKLLDIVSGRFVHTLGGHAFGNVNAVTWSRTNGHALFTGGRDCAIRVWDVRRPHRAEAVASLDMGVSRDTAAHQQPRLDNPKAHHAPVVALRALGSGLHVLSLSRTGELRLWEDMSGTGTFVNTLVNFEYQHGHTRAGQAPLSAPSLGGGGARARSSSPSAFDVFEEGGCRDALVFCARPASSSVDVLRLMTGELVRQLTGHLASVRCCSVRGEAQELWSGGEDGMLLVWEPAYLGPGRQGETDSASAQGPRNAEGAGVVDDDDDDFWGD